MPTIRRRGRSGDVVATWSARRGVAWRRESDRVCRGLGRRRQDSRAAGRRAWAGPAGTPGRGRSPRRASVAKTASVSTPSPTTRSFRLWPRSTMERTMAAWAGLASMSMTKLLSILSSWTGSEDRYPRDVCPMPKSSRLTRTPTASSWANTAAARGGSVSRDVSVISTMRRRGGTPSSSSTAMTCSANRPRPRVRADTLTETDTSPRSRMSVSAVRRTQVVSRSIRSVCSHRGMNRSGYNRPSVGCCQRTRASTASTRPSSRQALGW